MEDPVEERRLPRERELVLAPNEYAWVLDTTPHVGLTPELITFRNELVAKLLR